jgi:hypothetical protein
MKWHVAAGASRIIVEELCRLARAVPGRCLSGEAAIPAARMQSLCPSRLGYRETLAWLAAANVLRATRRHVPPGSAAGRGRPRLYRVNLPLVAWLAGVRKGGLSWAAHKPPKCQHVAPEATVEGKDATADHEPL